MRHGDLRHAYLCTYVPRYIYEGGGPERGLAEVGRWMVGLGSRDEGRGTRDEGRGGYVDVCEGVWEGEGGRRGAERVGGDVDWSGVMSFYLFFLD